MAEPSIPAKRRSLMVAAIVFSLLALASAALGAATGAAALLWVLLGVCLVFAAVVVGIAYGLRAPAAQPFAYELLDEIGSGSMGTVQRARHRLLKRPVALKTINSESVDAEDIARFKREARLLAALHSPHTVALYDYGTQSDGSLFYVMELLDGVDLQAFVTKHGAMRPERAVYVLRQVCHSLEEAHATGLVHRDLKPANIMLCRYGRDGDFVKVVDFGLAKGAVGTATHELPLTKEQTVLGTPAYFAPENLAGSARVEAKADVYALGCVAFWLLTGRLVFDYDRAMPMVRAHTSEAPSAPSQHAAQHVPPELDQLVLRCLAKSPAERPSAAELLAALESLPLPRRWTSDDARNWWAAEAQSSGNG